MMQAARGGRIFCRNSSSLSATKAAFSEGRNGVWGSNFQRRGRSITASVHSETPKPARRKITKDERYAMVISFVRKYKSNHAGKFPTPSIVKKEVGGCYYVIRKMLQELEYKSKGNFDFVLEESNRLQGDKKTIENTNDDKIEDIQSNDLGSSSLEIHLLKGKVEEVSDQNLEVPEGKIKETQVDRLEEEDAPEHDSDNFSMEVHSLEEEIKKASDQHLEVPENGKIEEIQCVQANADEVKSHQKETEFKNFEDKRQQAVSQHLSNSDLPGIKIQQHQQSLEDEKPVKNISSQQKDVAELKKSTFWGNLKSIADSFVNMWRKL